MGRRELWPVAAMAVILVGSQIVAMLLAPAFQAIGYQAFPEPGDPLNALFYIVLILLFTAVILLLVRFRRQNLAKYLILASILLTLGFVLLLPVYYLLPFIADDVLRSNVATVVAFVLAGLLVWVLAKYPEWYVVDAVGIAVAAGVTAIMGISFAIVPALLLLIGLAAYDAWAVYRTKHMVALADEMTSQRLPVLLVIPKHADYSFRTQKPLREHLASGEEREAMFIGLGDVIIPGIMSVSALMSLSGDGPAVAGLAPNVFVALITMIGSLVGFLILMRFVLSGRPQAGLPLLNGGAILAFAIAYFAIY